MGAIGIIDRKARAQKARRRCGGRLPTPCELVTIRSAAPSRTSVSKSSRSPTMTLSIGRSASRGARAEATARYDLRAHADEEIGQRAEKIGVAGDADLGAAELELAIDHGVGKLVALAGKLRRDRNAGDGRERLRKSVGSLKADQLVETPVGHAGVLPEQVGGAVHRAADDERCRGFAHAFDFRAAHAAIGQRRITLLRSNGRRARAPISGRMIGVSPKASIQRRKSSRSPGVSMDEASTLT